MRAGCRCDVALSLSSCVMWQSVLCGALFGVLCPRTSTSSDTPTSASTQIFDADISVSLPLDERRTRDAQNVTTVQKASLSLSLSLSSIDKPLELHPNHPSIHQSIALTQLSIYSTKQSVSLSANAATSGQPGSQAPH